MGKAKNVYPIPARRLKKLLEMAKKGEIKTKVKIRSQRSIIDNIVNEKGTPYDPNTLGRIMRGENNLQPHMAEQIASLFDDERITADWLLGRDDEALKITECEWLQAEIKRNKKEMDDEHKEHLKTLNALITLASDCGFSITNDSPDSEYGSEITISDGKSSATLGWATTFQLENYILNLINLTLTTILEQIPNESEQEQE